MIARPFASALLGAALLLAGERSAHAEPPGGGAIVVAVSPDATAAAKPLARDVYRDPALSPGIDDATARVLVGEPAGEGAPAKLKELVDLRASAGSSVSDAASRRLLAAIGADLKAQIVVSVTMEGGRPVAKVLRVETASFEGVELGATIETTPAGEKLVQWPGALSTLHKLLLVEKPAGEKAAAPATTQAPAQAAPSKTSNGPAAIPSGKPAPVKSPLTKNGDSKKEESKPVWTSPWFWATLGGVVAVGATAFAIAKATESDGGTLRLQGRVAP